VTLPAVKLQPYEQVDGTRFSVSTDEIVGRNGKPWRSGRNGVGLNEFDYGNVVYRFQDCGRLEEVTLQARVVTLGNILVPFESLAGFIRTHDPEAFERAGFVISPAFGLAFDPTEPFWVTALARHCLPEWKAL
jgi:hypothetical protein